jgi:ribosomal-protein-alanine N-acetyltransferase
MSVLERILQRDAGGDVTIAKMRRGDLRAGIVDIERASYPRPWSVGVFRSEIDQMRSGTRLYLVARRGRRIVGYAGLWFAVDEAHVTNVAVDPSERRTGVATDLLVALVEAAIDRGCEAWTLEVRVSSTGAQELYRRFGFTPAGVRKDYYENVEDAIVMWCHDIRTDGYRHRLEELRRERR